MNHERLISDTNSSNANYDRVYEYTDFDKTTNLLGGDTLEINDKISIGGVFSMVSEKGDVTSTDTTNRSYVWASTNARKKSRSGSASTDCNLIIIFGKIILINQLI